MPAHALDHTRNDRPQVEVRHDARQELLLARHYAIQALQGYTLAVARRFAMSHEEVVGPATGSARRALLAEVARIDAELGI